MNSYQVDRERWSELSFFEQMGNVAAEVGRSFRAQKMGDEDRAVSAMVRALDLFDTSIAGARLSRRRELLRAREQYVGRFLAGSDDGVENYLMQFAVAARLRR